MRRTIMDINEVIAVNLKRIREEQNLSLGQLAEKAGVSKVMLSQIEKGSSNPTINTIWKITGALEISYADLLEAPDGSVQHVKKAQIKPLDEDRYHIFSYYQKNQDRNFEIYQIEMEPGCVHESIGHSTNSSEYIMMIKGEIELEVNGQVHLLGKDDGFCFQATVPHVYRNPAEETAAAVLMISY